MVTVKPAKGFVDHQWNVTSLAGRGVSALGALVGRSVAAAVLEQNDLTPLFQRRLHLVAQHFAKAAAHAALLVLLSQVRKEDFRQHRPAKPFGEAHHFHMALPPQPLRFHSRGGRPHDQRHVLPRRHPQRHVTRVVARRGIVLLEAGFVFFVHHHESHLGQRQQHGGPRADDELA